MQEAIKLTRFSPGAGCGCKISPSVLRDILGTPAAQTDNGPLLVGNAHADDAAVYDLGDGTALISTTDFFTPITDDARDFGRIAAANALSDVFAMGGRPLMALSILGWPLSKLPPELASEVLEGAREVCAQCGIQIAGGHSIDSLEPIFGLAVNGLVELRQLQRNDTATAGCLLYLTKPLGIGVLTTAEKQGMISEADRGLARTWMLRLNAVGASLAAIPGVMAMTDVTGFGLLGHLLEMCEGSGLVAEIRWDDVPRIPHAEDYARRGAVPGGTRRNWASYGHRAQGVTEDQQRILCDPQTNGGLLIAVMPEGREAVEQMLLDHGWPVWQIGSFTGTTSGEVRVVVR